MLNHVIDDLYDLIKDEVGKQVKKSIIIAKLPSLFNKIDSVRKVKTLWQLDTAVDVETFYCDSHLVFRKKGKTKETRKRIDTISDIDTKCNIVIKGIAGQGKSILLRHLCAREFEAGKRIPIFIELRRIQNNETLLEHINRFLDILEIPINQQLFKLLSKSGKFIFFFDGFDEIQEENRPRIINELEYLVSCAPDSQFIVSTRPNTAVEMSPYFSIYTLDDLEGNEYKKVIQKLAGSTEYAKNLIKTIEFRGSDIFGLLCTPLLVTLLLISYKSYQSLPEQLSDFYESIFIILLQRHDGTKAGFVRPRRCLINDNQYRRVFDAFCYQSKRQQNNPLDYDKVYRLIQEAMEITNIKDDPECYLKDIREVTCLLLHEGTEYRFIHKSVQEYYSASFIRSRPDTNAIKFYEACLDYKVYKNWQQELLFLSEIDKYRYNKYYWIPLCTRWLGVESALELKDGLPPLTRERLIMLLGSFALSFEKKKYSGINTVFWGFLDQVLYPKETVDFLDREVVDILFSIDCQKVWTSLSLGEIVVNNDYLRDYDNLITQAIDNDVWSGSSTISVQQLIEEGFIPDEFKKIARRIADSIYLKWEDASKYVKNQDSFNIISQMNI
jgi:hypothetical protein